MKKLKVAITGILVLPWLACGNAVAADINVDIVGIAESKGEVLVTLFNRTEGWLRTGVGAIRIAAQAGSVKASFANLAEGEYAVSVIHDLNRNGKLDSNLIGIPVEPFGFSNDAKGTFGPPAFDQAKFKLGVANKTITVRLN